MFLALLKRASKAEGRLQGVVAGGIVVGVGIKGYAYLKDYVLQLREIGAIAEQGLLEGMREAARAEDDETDDPESPASR